MTEVCRQRRQRAEAQVAQIQAVTDETPVAGTHAGGFPAPGFPDFLGNLTQHPFIDNFDAIVARIRVLPTLDPLIQGIGQLTVFTATTFQCCEPFGIGQPQLFKEAFSLFRLQDRVEAAQLIEQATVETAVGSTATAERIADTAIGQAHGRTQPGAHRLLAD
ncbi:hypothetical protein D3C80_1135640 [compost metagenome]